MIEIAENGSLRRYGTLAWYIDALAETFFKNGALLSESPARMDAGRGLDMVIPLLAAPE